jgi:hypothetical protein
MRGSISRVVTGIVPAAAFACAVFLGGLVSASDAEARERPRGDWHRYCKDVDIRGDMLEADCRKQGGGWRRNTRINFDDCPNNEVTVHDGRLVCERRYGRNDNWNNGWDHDRRHWGWDQGRHNGWDRHDWDRSRHGHDRDRDWNGRRDNDRRDGRWDGKWDGRRDDDRRQATRQQDPQRQQQWQDRRDDDRRRSDRRDDSNRRRDDNNREEWWKRGNS